MARKSKRRKRSQGEVAKKRERPEVAKKGADQLSKVERNENKRREKERKRREMWKKKHGWSGLRDHPTIYGGGLPSLGKRR